MKRKAQAQIITTVLIIILVLVAMVIVWQVINLFIGKSSKDIEDKTNCFNIRLEITKALKGDNETNVKLVSNPGELSKLKILVNGNAENETADASNLTELETMVIDLGNKQLDSLDKVEVAAILKSGYTCPAADEFIVV